MANGVVFEVINDDPAEDKVGIGLSVRVDSRASCSSIWLTRW